MSHIFIDVFSQHLIIFFSFLISGPVAMPRCSGSVTSLHTIPEEVKLVENLHGHILEPQLSIDSSTSKVSYQRSNSMFVNALRKTSHAIITMTHSGSLAKDLNDDKRFSVPAIEAKRKNRRNGE